MKALAFEGVSHRYGRVLAVDEMALAVEPGELVCLLGPSGCGKTTTLRIAAGLERLQAGRVLIHGQVVADAATGLEVPPESRSVGLVFQDYALFPHLTVADNVAFGVEGMESKTRQARVAAVLEAVGMTDYASDYPHQLSGGQQQRVALARALAPRPRLMLLDEPFSDLDERLRDQVRDQTLHVLKDSGATTLMVTHDPEEAMFMADRIAVQRAGRIVQEGTPVDLYFQPKEAFVAELLGEINRFPVQVRDGRARTPFGCVRVDGVADGTAVEVLIRPEALKLRLISEAEAPQRAARVMASRMLGRSSLIHLAVSDLDGQHLHLHSRVPGRFLPAPDAMVEVEFDPSQAFIFRVPGPTEVA
ncbi:MAG: ABC transporter ATP-binding protein [Kiloniellales bacterium]